MSNILKVHGPTINHIDRWALREFVEYNLGNKLPAKVGVSFKVGKKRKLKTMRILSYNVRKCEYCGSHSDIEIRFRGEVYDLEIS